jgi:hypothetical protein
MRELPAQPQERREGQRSAPKQRYPGRRQFPALRSAPAVEPRVHINDQHTIFQSGKLIKDHKWKQLILVVNLLLGSRVNEITNKTFILDSHQLFICSALLKVVIVKKSSKRCYI